MSGTEPTARGTTICTGYFNDSDAANGNYTYTFATGFGSRRPWLKRPTTIRPTPSGCVITVSGHNDCQRQRPHQQHRRLPGLCRPRHVGGNRHDALFPSGCSSPPMPARNATARCLRKRPTPTGTSIPGPASSATARWGTMGTIMQTDNAYLPVFIHQIHAAIDNPDFEDQITWVGLWRRHLSAERGELRGLPYQQRAEPGNRQPDRQLEEPSDRRDLRQLPHRCQFRHRRQPSRRSPDQQRRLPVCHPATGTGFRQRALPKPMTRRPPA